ncbi:MAG TPA: DUF1444 family protein [Gallionellaceae bacterium]|nr:DUF1444 family protein [Gallionellaceae bacterium]
MKQIIQSIIGSLGLVAAAAAQEPLSADQFTKAVSHAISKTVPHVRVEIIRPLQLKVVAQDSRETTCFLDNAFASYQQAPNDKDEVIKKCVASYVEILNEQPGIDPTRVIPVIKDRGWLNEIAQSALETGAKEPPKYIHESLNQDLIVVYAEDTETNIKYLTPDELNETGIERRQLRKEAQANLERILPAIEKHGGDGVFMLTAGGDYEASLLLLDFVWTKENLPVKGDFIIAIPTRDLLLITGSNDQAGIEKVMKLSKEAYANGAYRLTPELFVFRSGHLERYTRPVH